MCTTSKQEATAWGPAAGAQKDSLKRKERRGCVAQRGQVPRQLQSPSLHLQSETRGNMDTCASCTEENTTKSILEEVEERKMSFYLLFIRRKED